MDGMDSLTLALILCTVLAVLSLTVQAGTLAVALVSHALGWMRRIPFLSNFGLQFLRLSLVCFLVAALCAAAALGLECVRLQIPPQIMYTRLPWLALTWPLGLVAAGSLISLILHKSWKALRKVKSVQVLGLICAVVGIWGGMYIGLNQVFLGYRIGQVPSMMILDILQPAITPAWILAAGQLGIVALGGGGTLGMLYLILRRQAEDFGRDYYRFALPMAAKWAALLLGQALALAWIIHTLDQPVWVMSLTTSALLGGSVLGFILFGILLLSFLRSANPLRAKARALGAVLCGLLSVGGAVCSQIWIYGLQGQ